MQNKLFDLLTYYEKEMAYLKNMGSQFSSQYPKVAQRLTLGEGDVSDPHVERLIQSFAFLTAFLQQDIHNEFPRIANALLTNIYPQFNHPIPPTSVAQFQVDPKQGKLTSGFTVAKDKPLFARSESGVTCKFHTGYDVELWPIQIEDISIDLTRNYSFNQFFSPHSHCLKIRLSTFADSFSELTLDALQFYINGHRTTQSALYEGIIAPDLPCAVALDLSTEAQIIPKMVPRPDGFSENETIFHMPSQAHPAYTLLLEYFFCPDKFFFFTLEGFKQLAPAKTIDILVPISNPDTLLKLGVDTSSLLLGCTPIINLFKKISDPIQVSHLQSEYNLIPDQRLEMVTEIYSVLSVSGIEAGQVTPRTLTPYFAFDQKAQATEQKAFWISRRTPTVRPGLPGTDILVSFVDFNFDPTVPQTETIYAEILCTNRILASQLPAGAILEVDDTIPTTQITCLKIPSSPKYPPEGGATLWSLVSQLSLNQISLSNSPGSLEAFKSLMRVYAQFGSPSDSPEVESLVKMSCDYTVQRMGTDAWRNFIRGISITLTFDERYTGGTSIFLFASILNQFFGLYVSLNSFTKLSIQKYNQEGIWKEWAPIAGGQPLL